MRLLAAAVLVATFVLALEAPATAQVVVNTCEQVVTGDGVLTGDLDCTGFDSIQIAKGSLNLAGFTLTAERGSIVDCDRACTIFSEPPGGTIVATTTDPILDISIFSPGNLKIHDIAMINVGRVWSEKSLFLTNVTRTDCGSLLGENRVSIGNVVSAGSVAHTARIEGTKRVKVEDSQFSASAGYATLIASERVKFADSSISGGADPNNGAIHAGKGAKILGGLIEGVRTMGVSATRLVVKECTITGNGVAGIGGSQRLRIRDSTITGNGGGFATCGVSIACADIRSDVLPKIDADSSCDTSYQEGSGIPGTNWAVCALD